MSSLVRARALRTGQTDCEQRLWARLRAHRLGGLKFRRQPPVGRYIVDFFCPEQRLIVELDGGQHQDRAACDASLRAQGYTVLRYWNNAVLQELDAVLEVIAQAAGVLTDASPSPQPLPPQGGGAQSADASAEPPRSLVCQGQQSAQYEGKEGADSAPSPLSLEGRGGGGEGGHCADPRSAAGVARKT